GAIGSSLALFLAEAGLKLAILDLNGKRAIELAEEISEKTESFVLGIETNVLDKQSLLSAKNTIHKKLGKVNYLINAAGGNSPKGTTELEFLNSVSGSNIEKSFYGLDLEGFKNVYELNFSGTLLPSMIFTRDMLEMGGGALINFSSMSAFHPLTRVSAYSAAKAAVSNFTEWLAVHLAKQNIRVNAVAPGFFVGEQNRFLLYDKDTGELTPRGEKIIQNTPMGRFGDFEEIHGTILYLLSDLAKFVTGVIIPIDGGFNAYSGV
ncbi:MAG: SDR family oxidoreductase, partial [Bacteroidota bacterium]|nr:SDR family oxidoreductase [Bacteroidota bacterium]